MKTVFFGGTIITMESEHDRPGAVLVEDGRIKKAGAWDEIALEAGKEAKLVDLMGRTLLPAFIDSHSHITALAQNLNKADLSGAKSFADIADILRKFKEQHEIPRGEYIEGYGYDHTKLAEGEHPDRKLLDSVSRENPIFITHVSCHMGVANSLALSQAGLDENTKLSPQLAARDEEGKLSGLLAETGMTAVYRQLTQRPVDWKELVEKAQQIYLSHGILTVQEGAAGPEILDVLKDLSKEGILTADIALYLMAGPKAHKAKEDNPGLVNDYQHHLRLAGYKLVLDGSPQGKTAWLSEPYTDGSNGVAWMKTENVAELAKLAIDDDMQLLVHCNGDAASQQFIDAYARALQESGNPKKNELRPVMVHSQTVRKEQLQQMKELGIRPTFFVDHVYRWGDVHYQNLGQDRAENISPAGWAKELSIPYTFHQDTPVLPPNMLNTVQIAVERKTEGGRQLGKNQRISVYEALEAVTIRGAEQYHEENQKGSIAPGKKAEFVVLDKNPLETAPSEISQIQVLAVIRGDQVLYQRTGIDMLKQKGVDNGGNIGGLDGDGTAGNRI